MKHRRLLLLLLCCGACSLLLAAEPQDDFEIRVLDKATRRGIPLVELITVHDVRYITDNAGRIAYAEPGQAGKTIFFTIEAQGYTVPKDGFGIAGVRLTIKPGSSSSIELERVNLAERLYRITGQDLYRDSILLGHETPLQAPLGSGQVSGQDSVQMVPYQGKLAWFWGDTNRLAYPLGLFRTAGATSPLPNATTLLPSDGIDLSYFTNPEGFARAMVDVPEQSGVVWIDGVCTVPDTEGRERLVAHFSRRKGLAEELEQGTLIYNDERQVFEVAETYPLNETWRHLADHPFQYEDQGVTYLTWGNPFPTVRVPATLAAVLDRKSYQAWSCTNADLSIRKTPEYQLDWNWGDLPPTTQRQEYAWIKSQQIAADAARFVPQNIGQPEELIQLHSGTVYWNAWRKRYVMVAVQTAHDRQAPSALGEVWYSEAESPQGPYRQAAKIVTHNRQTFYNPCQHPVFDQEGGRFIYFEGTYCNTFTNSPATQRYNYNQIMYRLDLSSEHLR